jgi:hypothetical protein
LIALAVQVAIWIWYVHTVPGSPIDALPSWWSALWEAGLLQVHWAFYRGVVSMFAEGRTILVLATLSLIVLPRLFDPRRYNALYVPGGYQVAQDWMCALLGTVIAVRLEMLWALVLAHALWLWAGGRIMARLGRKQAAGSIAASETG